MADTTAATMPDARCKAMLLDDVAGATDRAAHWMLAMQNRDGGWGAFDNDNTAEFLCHVPFADHNAMIDPSTPDLTARVLEAWLGWASDWGTWRSIARWTISAARRKPTAVGSAAGA